MHEDNYRMIDQVVQINLAVEAYREVFQFARESVATSDFDAVKKEVIMKSFEHPYVDCVLIFDKDEEIYDETMEYIRRLGLELQECSREEKHYRAIPKTLDAYKLVGRLAY